MELIGDDDWLAVRWRDRRENSMFFETFWWVMVPFTEMRNGEREKHCGRRKGGKFKIGHAEFEGLEHRQMMLIGGGYIYGFALQKKRPGWE